MKAHTKIALWYIGFGFGWIFLTDLFLKRTALDINQLSSIQTLKGWLFVMVSGLLIFYLAKKSFNDLLRKEVEKRSIFKQTLEGVYHILLNYLNAMQLVTLEAEKSADFDKTVLATAKSNTEKTKQALLKLELIESITEENIENAVYGEDAGTG